jgi:hypothetical protein
VLNLPTTKDSRFKKQITMLLPKPYISVSQINLWYSDRQKYINRYFLNLPEEPSIYMNFGKQFATSTETFIRYGMIDKNLPLFYLDKIKSMIGLEAEKEISLSINDIQVKGFIDAWDVENNRVIDFKTSGKPWTMDTLKDSLQMKVYALAMFVNGESIPESQINWLGTKRTKDGLSFTGESFELNHTFEMEELLKAIVLIEQTCKEISETYTSFLHSFK